MELGLTPQNTSVVANMQASSGKAESASFLDLVRNAPPRRGSIYVGSQELLKDKLESLQIMVGLS